MRKPRAIDVEKRVDGAVYLAAKVGRAEPIMHFLAFPSRHDQSCALEQTKVVRDGGAGHTHKPRNARDALLAMTQYPKNFQSRSVAEL